MSENDRVFRRVSRMSDLSRLVMAVLLLAAVLLLKMMMITNDRRARVRLSHHRLPIPAALGHTLAALTMLTTRLGNNASNEGSEEHGGSKKTSW